MLAGGIACGGGSEVTDRPTADCTPLVPAASVAPGIEALALQRWGTITVADARAGFLGAEVVSEQEVVEIYPDLIRRLGSDYTFLGGENEGFEAELSFADRKERVLSFTLREIVCDRVLIRVLIEKGGA